MGVLLGVVADDYTGASDIANTLAKGGLATVQFLGVPTGSAPAGCEAAVVSLKSRSIPAADAVAVSLDALRWLRGHGCRQFVFKYCSTFDSTPAGNIGPVGEALAEALGVSGVPACPAFPATGRTVFQGHLFVGDRLLSESGLENHPLNPMTDPDLRRWLARQSRHPVGLVPWSTVQRGPDTIRTALAEAGQHGERLVIVDAASDGDLLAIGLACADLPLVTGGSGIALGLPANFIAAGVAGGAAQVFRAAPGPGAILSGSCSPATLRQVELHRTAHPALGIPVEAALDGQVSADQIAAFVAGHREGMPLVFTSSSPAEVRANGERYGQARVSQTLEELFATAARRLVENGLTRLVVAGGETSGAVVSALGLTSLAVGPEIDPGVPALSDPDGPPLALALKSGNFGGPDFFAKALDALGPPA